MAMYGSMWTVATGLCPSCFCKAKTFYRLKSSYLRDIINVSSFDPRYKTSLRTLPSLRNIVPYISRLHLSNGNIKDSVPNETKQPKKPKEIKTYITVFGIDKSMYITTVEDATKLAERRNFKLVKIQDYDTKSGRPVYQLMTKSQFLNHDKDEDENTDKTKKVKESHIKGEKAISLNSTISENDAKTKVNMMKKWLSKMLQIKVIITGDASAGEKVSHIIEKEIESFGSVMKKKSKGGMIRLEITPPKNATGGKSSLS